LVPVPLDAGAHTLLIKITQGTATWGFLVDACDSEGWPIALWNGDNKP
jgi:hypothetical protein